MWRKIYKVVFYISLALLLLAVAITGIVFLTRGGKGVLYGALILVGGVILVFFSFSFIGMIIEMCDNIQALRNKLVGEKKSKKDNKFDDQERFTAPVAPVTPEAPVVQEASVASVAPAVQETPMASVAPAVQEVPVTPIVTLETSEEAGPELMEEPKAPEGFTASTMSLEGFVPTATVLPAEDPTPVVEQPQDTWVCKCGNVNKVEHNFCIICGSRRP